MKILSIVTCFILAVFQGQQDITLAERYFKIGEQLYSEGRYKLAADTLRRSATIFEQAEKTINQIKASNLQAECLSNLNQCDVAARLLQKNLGLLIGLTGDNNQVLADTYYYLSRNTGGCSRKFDDAIKLMQKSMAIKRVVYPKDDPSIAQAYTFLGYVYNSKGKYDSALIYLDSIRIKNLRQDDIELSHTLFNIAASYEGKSQLGKALELNLESLKIRTEKLGTSHATMSNSINAIGRIYRKLGNNERALEYYRRALEIRKQTLGEDHPNVAASYYEIGNLYGNLSNHHASLEFIQEGNRILESNTQIASDILPTYVAYAGKMYGLIGQHDNARVVIRKAITMAEKNLATDHPYRAIVYNLAGDYYGEAGDIDEQTRLFKKAIAIYQRSYGAGSEREADVISKMAATYAKHGKASDALISYNRALAIYTNKLGTRNPKVATVYLGLGEMNALQDNKLEARASYDRAQASISGTNNNQLALKVLRGIAQIESGDTSLMYYRRALTLLNEIARGYTNEAARTQLEKEKREMCEAALKIAWSRNYKPLTNDGHVNEVILKRMSDAFDIVENSKASLLLENARDQWAKTIAGVPDSLVDKERDVRIELEYYKTNLYQARKNKDSSAISNFEKNIFASERRLEQIKSKLETGFPSYYKLKYNSPAITLPELMKILPENTIVLQYFVGKDEVYTLRISRDRAEHGDESRDVVERQIASYQRSLSDSKFIVDNPLRADSLYVSTSRELFRLLGFPSWVGKTPDKIIVIPDGFLGQVNFGPLIYDPHNNLDLAKPADYKTLPYALNRYDVSYAYSATFLDENLRTSKNSLNNNFAGFAPSYNLLDYSAVDTVAHPMTALAMRSGNLPLPGAAEEVNVISGMMHGKSWLAEEATETNFKKYGGEYGVLHLAMHSLLNDEEPRYSELLFNHNKDIENDGYLSVAEIYNLKLNAQMVVLSSCNSGFGKVQYGEGPISLSRAFSYAGCPSVVMSLWKVPDLVTTKIMTNFYENVSNGLSKDEALRKAQQQFMAENKDPLYRHPYYWAGFVVMGDTSPIDMGMPYLVYLIAGFLTVVTGALIVRRRK